MEELDKMLERNEVAVAGYIAQEDVPAAGEKFIERSILLRAKLLVLKAKKK